MPYYIGLLIVLIWLSKAKEFTHSRCSKTLDSQLWNDFIQIGKRIKKKQAK